MAQTIAAVRRCPAKNRPPITSPERERTASEIGELIMRHLQGLDTVAYIRFASVYRDFKDVREFKEELEGLLDTHRGTKSKK